MFIVLAILGICITIEKLNVWQSRMYIHTPGWHTIDSITSFPSLSLGGTGGAVGGSGLPSGSAAGSVVGVKDSWCLQHVWRLFAVLFSHERQPAM